MADADLDQHRPAYRLAQAQAVAVRLVDAASTTLIGKSAEVEAAVACVLAGGHLLLEDAPGVGKTLLAQSLAASIGGTFGRIQGTPDLLPGDVTGAVVPDEGEGWRLRFREGPIFAHVVLFDELNRTSPRTQSALLEAAEERAVSVDGHTHPLPRPFVLLATQNPLGQAGTYPLAEGTLDRFTLALTIGRAAPEAERAVLMGDGGRGHLDAIRPVTDPHGLALAQEAVSTVHLAEPIADYVVRLLDATRRHVRVRMGVSTRGGLALIGLARARAVMAGRDHVTPADIQAFAVRALSHRLLLTAESSTRRGARGDDDHRRRGSRPTTVTNRHAHTGGSRPTRVAPAAVSQLLAIALACVFALTFGATPMYIVAVALVTAVCAGVVLAVLGAHHARVISIDGPIAAIAGSACELHVVARAPRLVEVEARQDGAVVARWSQHAGECRGAVTAHFAHRGVVDHLDVVVTCAGPFGTWNWARPATVLLGAPIAVGPAPLTSTAAEAMPAPADGTGTMPSRRSEPGALHGVRPWSDGDPISWVHWPSVARTGELLVREWEPPDDPHVEVRVDRCADGPTAERTTGLAAGAIDAALARGAVVHLSVPSPGGATRTVVVHDRWSAARALAEADLPRLDADETPEGAGSATSGWPARAAVVGAVMIASGALLGALSWPAVPTAISLFALPLAVFTGSRGDRQGTTVRAVASVAAVAVLARLAVDIGAAGRGGRLDGLRDGLVELLLALVAIHTATAVERPKLRFSLGASATMIGYAAAVRLDREVVWWATAWLVAVGVAYAALHAEEVRRSAGSSGLLPRPSPAHRSRQAARTALVVAAAAVVGLGVLVLVPVPEGPLRVFSSSFLPSRLLRVPGEGSLGAVDADGTVVVSDPDGPADRDATGTFGYAAFAASFDLFQRGRLGDDVVMRVRAPSADFWRGQTFERFDGRRWYVADETGLLFDGPVIDVPLARGDVRNAPSDEMTQTFSLEVGVPNLVFAAQRPERLQIDASVWVREDGALRADSVLPAGTVYTVVSRRPLVTPAGLAAQGSPQAGPYVDAWARQDLVRDLQLPDSTSDRVRALAHTITDPYPDVYSKEQAIERWMADNVEYDLNSPVPPQGADAVDDFLFESRRGFCEQIASATVVMLRAVGVPARVAAGYTPGDRDPLSGTFVVRNKDAHAWTEVWFPATGWQAFDPTASVPLAADSAGSRSLGAPLVGAITGWVTRWSMQIAALAVLAALAWLAVRSRSVRRHRRQSPAWDAQRRFEQVCRSAGVRAAPSDTNEVLAVRLGERSSAVAAAAARAGAAVDRAAFGVGDPHEAGAEVEALAEALRA